MNACILTAAQIDSYARHLHSEERAPATIEKYLRDVRIFSAWLQGRPVTKELASQWKAALLAENQAPATVNTKLSAINGLFRFLGWDDCRVKFLKLQRRVFRDASRELSRGDYDKLLEAAGRLGLHRLELLLQTICATGVRVSEVRYITVEAALAGRAEIASPATGSGGR